MDTRIAPTTAAGTGTIDVVEWQDGPAWDRFVDAAADGTIAHRWAWRDIVQRSYGLKTHMLAAVEGAQLRGVLPLVVHRSRLFGRHVVSMPFLDVGWPLQRTETTRSMRTSSAQRRRSPTGSAPCLSCDTSMTGHSAFRARRKRSPCGCLCQAMPTNSSPRCPQPARTVVRKAGPGRPRDELPRGRRRSVTSTACSRRTCGISARRSTSARSSRSLPKGWVTGANSYWCAKVPPARCWAPGSSSTTEGSPWCRGRRHSAKRSNSRRTNSFTGSPCAEPSNAVATSVRFRAVFRGIGDLRLQARVGNRTRAAVLGLLPQRRAATR